MADKKQIITAKLDWGASDTQAAPRSVLFDDIYFSGDGPAETDHVFLCGNDLPARFSNTQRFSIGELGFGAGLNFLCAWDSWRQVAKPDGARLSFFSVEAFPLTPTDLARTHAQWPQLTALSQKLVDVYPLLHPGFHRLHLDNDVSLTIFFGDALHGLSRAEGKVDAWFLDGFSPAKNPDMWRPELMAEIARLSNTRATLATFSVAGGVRRALQSAGFTADKRPGYGRKREMLAGLLTKNIRASRRKPWFDTREASKLKAGARIAVIGAGIAGAAMARALRQAGMTPIVYETNAPASGASGNPAGLIMPRLDAGDTPDALFHVAAYLYTMQLLLTLNEHSAQKLFNQCGAILHAQSEHEARRHKKLLAMSALPADWMRENRHGLLFPQGGVVNPRRFVRALLGETPTVLRQVKQLQPAQGKWRIISATGEDETFDAVVIANSLNALQFAQSGSLPLTGYAGQIDYFPNAAAPECARVFGPYIAPCPDFDGNGGGLVIGATYAPIAIGEAPATSAEATRSNIEAVSQLLPDLASALTPEASIPRASIRCVTPDWMPVAGPMPDWGFYTGAYEGVRDGRLIDYPAGQTQPGLYILSGLGSRGLVTAPLCATIIAAEIAGAPSPVETSVAEALHPARFCIRELKRAKAS
jgi:tRNA 5-methylaminomethyl-2-thiouridine biosynthesis bifunctional protein